MTNIEYTNKSMNNSFVISYYSVKFWTLAVVFLVQLNTTLVA